MSESPVPITPGTGGASIASDLVSGNNYQQIKVVDGTLGSNTALKVNADNSITASVYGTIGASIIGIVPVNVISGGSTGSVATNIQGSVATVIIGGSIAASFTPPVNQSVSGTVGASIIGQLPTGNAVIGAVAASISGTVQISSIYGNISGSVVAFQGTSPWAISGSVATVRTGQSGTVITSVSGTVTVVSSITGGIFPISGSVSAVVINNVTVVSSIAGGIFPISGSVAATITNTNINVSGSVVAFQGTVPWTIGSVYGNISGSVFAVVQGLQGASVSGSVGIVGNPSISGTVQTVSPFASSTQGITSVMTGTTSVLVLAAPGGTSRNYITHILVTNAAAVGTIVTIQDGASILWGGFAAASGGGWSENFNPPLPQPTSVKALYATSATQASVFVAINGFTGV